MGSGPAPRRALAAAATTALLAAAPLGCAGGDPGPPPATSSAPTAPQDVCTRLITHWAGVILDAGEGRDAVALDYQSMGLSGGQNDILRAVLADARAERDAKGPAAARELTAREAERRCADRYRSGTPTGGPWQ
ncbi:hypothetical protein [Streptomyces sp. NBC_01244]|uniref:hypothetical protein n=1 Tax=Streptomyces sp. NBC_01244 TaxID=2903797 RepID=UPI002E10738B|nr:hypothetical protein OG247_11775 [Streptomyces sp. NBC_01244]